MFKSIFTVLVISLSLIGQAYGHADKAPEVTIKAQKLTDGVYALFGQGGNIGLSVGDDGVYIIDDQFAPLTSKIKAAIKKISDQPVRFVINTHWHFDHTGGNENFGKENSLIVAHDNVYKRMSTKQVMKAFNNREVPAAPKAALPVITFDSELTLRLNDDNMRVYHVANAHTDGDAIIFFENDNVLHMGDCYFNIGYPFIDLGSGGTIDGYIAALEKGLSLAKDDTQIIPGHGPMASKADMFAYVNMLKKLRNKIADLKTSGQSLEQAVQAKPSAEFDAKSGKGFIKADQIVTAIYNSLK